MRGQDLKLSQRNRAEELKADRPSASEKLKRELHIESVNKVPPPLYNSDKDQHELSEVSSFICTDLTRSSLARASRRPLGGLAQACPGGSSPRSLAFGINQSGQSEGLPHDWEEMGALMGSVCDRDMRPRHSTPLRDGDHSAHLTNTHVKDNQEAGCDKVKHKHTHTERRGRATFSHTENKYSRHMSCLSFYPIKSKRMFEEHDQGLILLPSPSPSAIKEGYYLLFLA